MSFLNLIRNDVCHADHLVVGPGPSLQCTVCQKQVILVREIINRPDSDYFRSSQLAQAYAAWTGDEEVPMSFPLSHIEGIYDGVVVGQPLSRVRKSIQLLRALNAPFTTDPTVTAPPDTMQTFLTEFLDILYQQREAKSSDEEDALHGLMKSMYDILTSKEAPHPFQTYFSVLVPFVQTAAVQWQPMPAEPEHPNLARELHTQLIRSHLIRKMFSRYAIPFDVLHVMVGCYACSCHMEVVGNWALDFLARICRGEFFWKQYPHSPFIQKMQRLIRKNMRHGEDFCRWVIRPLKYGESKECYSTLWLPLHRFQALLRKHFFLPKMSPDVLEVAFQHAFPAVLFNDYADQLGFMMGYNHLILTVNKRNGQLPKGAFKKAREIHDVVHRFVQKMQRFEEGGKKPIWNLDMLKLFFASDEQFHQEIMNVVRCLVKEEEEE